VKQNIIPADAVQSASDSVSPLTRLARHLLLGQLGKIRCGRLRLIDAGVDVTYGAVTDEAPFDVTLRVRNPRFYSDVVFAGTVGAGEAYINGYWHCDDLLGLVRLMVVNLSMMDDVDSGWSRLSAPILRFAHWMNRNDKLGSKRNISAHYDLGNRFFELFLDETMAYSCGIFERPEASLFEASVAKFDAACSKLALRPGQHLLEIGTGWGGLAIHAAARYGCSVTTTTISREQYDLAREKIARAGLTDRITVLLEDYRDLTGQYDALVSIEMIEAVGHQFLDTYFRRCSSLLKPTGAMLLQSITIRDQFYDHARRSVDFIKRFIFRRFRGPRRRFEDLPHGGHRTALRAHAAPMAGTVPRPPVGGPGPGLSREFHPHVGVLSVLLRRRLRGAALGRRADVVDETEGQAWSPRHGPCRERLTGRRSMN
jgi:cyclopropane-fatty-acyl-phospholipid synthase